MCVCAHACGGEAERASAGAGGGPGPCLVGGTAPASLTRGAPAVGLWHFVLHDASVPRVGPRSPHRLAFAPPP